MNAEILQPPTTKTMNRLLLLIFSFFSFSAIAQSKEEKLWQQVNLLHKAVFETKDSLVIAKLVGEKLTYGHSGGNLEKKNEMVHKAAISPTTYKNISTERISLDFVKKAAIVRLIFRATSIEKGVEAPLNLSILQVWAKEGGDWKLQARQAVKVNPK
jgi:hypothetical protein